MMARTAASRGEILACFIFGILLQVSLQIGDKLSRIGAYIHTKPFCVHSVPPEEEQGYYLQQTQIMFTVI